MNELESVVGGTASEFEKDIELFKFLGMDFEKDIPSFISSKARVEIIGQRMTEAFKTLGIDYKFSYDDKLNQYKSLATGEDFNRSTAQLYAGLNNLILKLKNAQQ